MALSSSNNDILNDDNYFLWEFSARMALARKGLAGHVEITPEKAVALSGNEMWKTADSKAMGVIAKMLSSPYQAMIRNAKFAVEAWIILQQFHVKRSLHNRLRKQLHELVMNPGDNIMDHLLKFDDVCMRLDAVGDNVKDDEQLVVLLGSLPPEYDAIVKIIEARGNVDLYEAKEMLRREYETLQKRERQEAAFKSAVVRYDGRGRNGGLGKSRNGKKNKRQDRGQSGFQGRCFDCNKVGHKKDQCPKKNGGAQGEASDAFVFSVSVDRDGMSTWLLDSGASSHMTFDRDYFVEFRSLVLANGNTAVVKDVLYIPGLDLKTGAPLEMVHTDLMGPINVKSKSGARFILVFVDDWSRYLHVYLLKSKTEVTSKFIEYTTVMERQTGGRVKCVRSDNGSEFCNKKFDGFCLQQGILHQTSAPYSPQQNGIAERANRSIAEMARAMLYYQQLSLMINVW
ncbi:hypothetical protein ATCC90586_007925 [Pythium insidiosum]|nr:hypothetical protein ATCC90586_007925 [Pythium insidiosum]